MQSNQSGFPTGSGDQQQQTNPFGSTGKPAFSFSFPSTVQAQQQRASIFKNPFQKVLATPTTLYGMNINPAATNVSSVSTTRPRMQFGFSFQQAPTSAQPPQLGSTFQAPRTELFRSQPESPSDEKYTVEEANKTEENEDKLPSTDNISKEEEVVKPEINAESNLEKETPSIKSKQLKRSTSVDISILRTIVVYEIPEDSNNKLELTKHFQQFGNITRIFPNIKRRNATVTFDCHDAAAKAKKSGTKLRPGVELKILWKQTTPKERKTSPLKPEAKDPAAKASDDGSRKPLIAKRPGGAPINLSEGLPIQMSEDELQNVLLQPARTAPEKATILDARDRLVRLRKEKLKPSSDVKSVAVLKGTCPDMCPEKERYVRVEKRRLASYEILNSHDKDYEVDHRLAVKEYSRSSADQAEPLAHELRPLPVLKMTMDYLISSIMDRCDYPSENLAEWFNFLWDRTRGIRKDLTQQSLCELGAVDLVEKCARFHIHCTARLCELDMQDFDQKINDENLTKCMQTLKHMYYDLSIKQINCPNEAEFRAYDILLHLNVGDILREVQQLRDEVRESPKVRAALQFLSAVSSRNYVRFFKLAKKNEDYLMCCLLQRYFNQIRNSALQIMIQAFGPPKKAQIPVSNLIEILGFEDQEEAATWCRFHGLSVELDKDVLFLERSTFIQMPENFPPKRRSHKLIESKRHCPISQIIANGLTVSNQILNHQPHISFDEQGLLLKEAWMAEDQGKPFLLPSPSSITTSPAWHQAVPATVVEANPPPLPHSVPQQQTAAPSQHVLMQKITVDLFNVIVGSTVDEMVEEMAHLFMRNVRNVRFSYYFHEQMLDEVIRNFCVEVFQEVRSEIEAERNRAEQRRLELKRKQQFFTQALLNDVIESVIHEYLESFGTEVIQNAKLQKAAAMKEELSRQLMSEILNDVVDVESLSLSKLVAQETIHLRESLIREARQRVLHRRIYHCFDKWRRFAIRKIRRRAEQQTFPAGSSFLTYDKQVKALSSKGEPRVTPSTKRKSVVDLAGSVKRLNTLSELHFSINNMETEMESKSMDLLSVLRSSLRHRLHNTRSNSWKLTIFSVGSDQSYEIGNQLRAWFGLEPSISSSNGWTYVGSEHDGQPVNLSVTYASNLCCLDEDLRGANALLLIFDSYTGGPDLVRQLLYLSQFISTELPYTPPTVAFIDSNNATIRPIEIEDVIRNLNPCDILSMDFVNPPVDRLLKLSRILMNMVESTKCLWPIGLKSSSLWDYAHDFFLKKMSPTIHRDLKTRLSFALLHKPLSVIIEYHNDSIHQLSTFLSDPELDRIKWPAPELTTVDKNFPPIDWNTQEYQQKMANMLEKHLTLPEWDESVDDFAGACIALGEYCKCVAVDQYDVPCLSSRLNSILKTCELELQRTITGGIPQKENIPWTFLYQAFVDYRFQSFSEEGKKHVVGYFPNVFAKFQPHLSWINSMSWTALTDAVSLRQTLEKSQLDAERRQPFLIGAASQEPKEEDVIESSSDVPEAIAALCDVIHNKNRQAKQENERFEEMLNLAISSTQYSSLSPSPRRLKTPTPKGKTGSPMAPTPSLNLLDHLERLEESVERSKRENRKFETFLKRALEQ